MSLISKIISLGIILFSVSPKLRLPFKREIYEKAEAPLQEPSEQALLKEYETCQSELGSRGNQFWVSLSIIISINLILLSQAAYNIINGSLLISGYINLLAVSILGVTMVFINVVFYKWQKRQHYVSEVIFQRMRKIEDVTGMHRNWLIYGRDLKENPSKQREWQRLSHSRREFIEELLASYASRPYSPQYKISIGDKFFGHILCILIILWLLLPFLLILI